MIVATPGRLVDHLYDTPDLDLTGLEYLVVDEADRMIEELKNNWFRLLERAVFSNADVRPPLDFSMINHFEKPSPPLQKLLFSATLSYDPQRFEALKLYLPKLFAVVDEKVNGDIMMRNDQEVIASYTTPEGLKVRKTLTYALELIENPKMMENGIVKLSYGLGKLMYTCVFVLSD